MAVPADVSAPWIGGQTSSSFISVRETDSDPDGEDERQIGKDGTSGKTHDAQDHLQPFNVKERIGRQGAWICQCTTETKQEAGSG